MLGVLLAILVLACGVSSEVLVLTDANFDKTIAESDKDFLIDIYAPWWIWQKVAEDLEGQVHVAKIDATANDALPSRFFVAAFPTIVHLRGGKTRHYTGVRERSQLVSFALEDWSEVKPVAFYMAPNSGFGRLLGWFLGLPSQVFHLYTYMENTLHMSQLAIIFVFLLFPVLLGIAAICMLEFVHTRPPPVPMQFHEHQQ